MKKGFVKRKITGRDSRSTELDRLSSLVQLLSGIDLPQFQQKIAKAVSRAAGFKSVVWLVSEDTDAHGPIFSSNRLTRSETRYVRSRCNDLFRKTGFEYRDKNNFFWSFIDQGRVTYLVLLNVPPKRHEELGALRVLIEALFKSACRLTEAKELAFIDDVTQLYNQRYLQLVLDKEIRRAERASSPFSVLFIDIDHFKNVNDSSGHMIGSKLLCQVSEILKQNMRMIDYGFRYGGDEFILILVGTGSDAAVTVGERIRSQVASTPFLIDGRKMNLTLSIGVASFPEHAQTKEEIIRLADEAMYESKNKSRNLVSIAG